MSGKKNKQSVPVKKNINYDDLSVHESVLIATVFVLAVSAGTLQGLIWFA